jgi:molecular chaperone GrpE
LSDSEDDPADSAGAMNPPEVADPESLTEVPAADDEGAAEAYQQRARLAEDRLAEVLAAYREFRRETEAYRDRLTRQLHRKFDSRHEALLLKFIDILDNFDRALEASQTAGDSLVEGLILVRAQLLQVLQEEGLERIPVVGLPFDPHVSESVTTVPVHDPDQHHVVMQELLRGYRLKGRIARPSQVVIGEYAGSMAATAPPPKRHQEPLIGEPVPAVVPAVVVQEGDSGPSLDEIIARAEARDAAQQEEAPIPAILYDDLTELAEVDEDVVRPDSEPERRRRGDAGHDDGE